MEVEAEGQSPASWGSHVTPAPIARKGFPAWQFSVAVSLLPQNICDTLYEGQCLNNELQCIIYQTLSHQRNVISLSQ